MKKLCLVILSLASTSLFAASSSCTNVAGTYISPITTVVDVDTGQSTTRSVLIQVKSDGTILYYHSAELEQLSKVGVEMFPSMGNWVCTGNNQIQAVMFDYFSHGTDFANDGEVLGQQVFKEYDRISAKISVNSTNNTASMDYTLIGINADPTLVVLQDSVAQTVYTGIRHVDLRKIVNIPSIVDYDFNKRSK